MNWKFKAVLGAMSIFCAAQAAAQISFYEREGFRGRVFSTSQQVRNFERYGFNDRASSIVVERGRWEVCTDARFEGRCVVLRRGSYGSLQSLGLTERISSVRPVNETARYENEVRAPLASPDYEYRRRPTERITDVPITSVRAVVGPPEQRCWIERQQVEERRDGDPGAAVLGAIIGGVLGHQIGGGRGKDAATVGGAIAGAAIGSNTNRNDAGSGVIRDRDVQRCKTVSRGKPDYWDVTYDYRGVEHRIQMSTPPGSTIAVNQRGEPRE